MVTPPGALERVALSSGEHRTIDLDALKDCGLAHDSPLFLHLAEHGLPASFEPFVLDYLRYALQDGFLPENLPRQKVKHLIAFADHFAIEKLQDLAWAALARLDGVAAPGARARVAGQAIKSTDIGRAAKALQRCLEKLHWTVVVTPQLIQSLQEARPIVRMSCLQSLMELGAGLQDTGLRQKHQVVDADHGLKSLECGPGWLLLWRIDLGYDAAQHRYVEVIEAYALVRRDQVQATVEGLRKGWRQLIRGRATAREAVQQTPPSYALERGRRVRLPRSVPGAELDDFAAATAQPLHELTPEVLTYLNRRAVTGGEPGSDHHLPIRMSRAEADLITRDGPVVVVGRSGTGKTVTAVYRLWAHHRSYRASQLFLTLSTALCRKVEAYFEGLERVAGNEVSTSRQPGSDPVATGLWALAEPGAPAFLSFREFMQVLDGELVTPFFPRQLGSRAINTSRVVFANEIQLRLANSNVRIELDFDRFLAEIWPKLAGSSPVPAALLWREIQTVIKGSLAAGQTEEGFLSEEQYLHIGHKLSPGVHNHREQVYKSFRLFRKHCSEGRFFDRNDVAFHISSQLNHGLIGQLPKIDSIYIDEVQDLSQLELSVVVRMCREPRTLFMAGDSSQTISAGVDFRFCDLVSICIERFHNMPPVELQSLTTNWRSRAPIVRLSNTVVQCIEAMFPQSIDILPVSAGTMDGPTPVFVHDSFEKLCAALLKAAQSREAAFGADFAVLVRTEAAKALVSGGLAGSALVLTIEESKGLEFNACVVWDFFTDSPYNDWGVLRRFINEPGLLKHKGGKRPNIESKANQLLCSELKKLYVALTRSKHSLWLVDSSGRAAPCLELWRSGGLAQDGQRLIREGGLGDLLDSMTEELFVTTGVLTSWCQVGTQLLEAGQYRAAQQCFLRAGDEGKAELCQAHLKTQEAEAEQRAARGLEAQRRAQQTWRAAAALFERHDQARQAACLANGGPHAVLEAARIYVQIGDRARASQLWEAIFYGEAGAMDVGLEEWTQVAELHHSLGESGRAAAAYERARQPAKAAAIYTHLARDLEQSNANYRQSTRWETLKREALRCFRQANQHDAAAACLAELTAPQITSSKGPSTGGATGRLVVLRHRGTAPAAGEALARLEDPEFGDVGAAPQQGRATESSKPEPAANPRRAGAAPPVREKPRVVVLQHRGTAPGASKPSRSRSPPSPHLDFPGADPPRSTPPRSPSPPRSPQPDFPGPAARGRLDSAGSGSAPASDVYPGSAALSAALQQLTQEDAGSECGIDSEEYSDAEAREEGADRGPPDTASACDSAASLSSGEEEFRSSYGYGPRLGKVHSREVPLAGRSSKRSELGHWRSARAERHAALEGRQPASARSTVANSESARGAEAKTLRSTQSWHGSCRLDAKASSGLPHRRGAAGRGPGSEGTGARAQSACPASMD